MFTKELSPDDASLAERKMNDDSLARHAMINAGNNGSGAVEAAVGLGLEPTDAISLAVEVATNHSDLASRIGDAATAIAISRGEVKTVKDNKKWLVPNN